MASSEAQKSQVHDSTADADGSPTAEGDSSATRSAVYRAVEPEHPHRMPSPLTDGTHIVKDETDVGGPLIIESDDPELSPPHVPIDPFPIIDPFPTDGTPEIDPPIER